MDTPALRVEPSHPAPERNLKTADV